MPDGPLGPGTDRPAVQSTEEARIADTFIFPDGTVWLANHGFLQSHSRALYKRFVKPRFINVSIPRFMSFVPVLTPLSVPLS
jgi:hypothetical protein